MTTSIRSRGSRSRAARVLAVCLCVSLVVSGCGSTEDAIRQAIDELGRQPAAWDLTLTNTIDKLEKAGGNLVDEVQALLTTTQGQAENFMFCAADFFGHRVKTRLEAMLHDLNANEPDPVIVPVVCNTEPATKVESDKTTVVTYFGYDFLEFAKSRKFTASVVYSDGSIAAADFGGVAVTSNYQMGVNISGSSWAGIDRARNPKLVLRWGSASVTNEFGNESALPVVIPAVVVPQKSTRLLTATGYAGSEGSVHCTLVDFKWDTPAGWKADTTLGDPGHPGVAMVADRNNRRANDTLRVYNYQVEAGRTLHVTGQICAEGGWGKGAIFERDYLVYLVEG